MEDMSASMASQGSAPQLGVLDAKLARRKLQQDVDLLANRVERLRQEERKAKQKVLETKLRGQEIAALQKRNEQAAAARTLAKRLEEEHRKKEMQQVCQSSLPAPARASARDDARATASC
jgi:predicted RNase H-like nuclease (RuvC/YqgF family)